MAGLGEIIGGFSGLKWRLLLFVGILLLVGMAWGGGREFFKDAGFSGVVPPHEEMRAEWEGGPGWGEVLLGKADLWSQRSVELGASFIVAMLVASLLRAALKTGITLIVLAGIAIWFLESRGYVSLWDEYYQTMQEGGAWVTSRSEGLLAVLKTHLPSSFAAATGFGFGLRR